MTQLQRIDLIAALVVLVLVFCAGFYFRQRR
jgi:hypothetical protein